MGRHSQYLRMKIKGKHSIVYNKITGEVNRQKKGKYLKKAQDWVCPKCKYKNNQSSYNCHGRGCNYKH